MDTAINSGMTAWESAGDPLDTWRRKSLDESIEARDYVSQYSSGGDYNWQSHRSGFCVSGSAPSREAAMAEAEKHRALCDTQFFAIVIPTLEDEIAEREKKLFELGATSILRGYHAGFEAGFAEARRCIEVALADGLRGGQHA